MEAGAEATCNQRSNIQPQAGTVALMAQTCHIHPHTEDQIDSSCSCSRLLPLEVEMVAKNNGTMTRCVTK
jgi:hypothetical protein